ncbi:MAG: ricin B lectin domain-containing protein [Podila humilis]|nr:MAG: ricin B lectin domain-containing protein [Podila humilis]
MMKLVAFVLLTFGGCAVHGQEALISSASSSKCIEVQNFSKIRDGSVVELNDCNNSTAQMWNIFSGLTEVKLADPDLNFCIDAIDVDTGNNVVMWECNQNPQQQWIFTDDGLLTLANNTNLCLEVPNSSTKNGTPLRTFNCNDRLNQVWNLV